MGRKVLISFLGAGPSKLNEDGKIREYRKAKYKLESKDYEASFVSSVIKEHYDADLVIILGTMGSMWEELYHVFKGPDKMDDDYYLKLIDFCKDASPSEPLSKELFKQMEEELPYLRVVPIYWGITEEEIEANLSIILENLKYYLEKNDEIILDITHSFRSLPLLSTTAMLYLQDVLDKKVEIVNILYGMLDVIHSIHYAPIVSLKAINQLNSWIKAGHSFRTFGRAGGLLELLEAGDIKTAVNEMDQMLGINYAASLREKITTFEQLLSSEEFSGIAGMVLKPVFEDFVKKFRGRNNNTDSAFQISLAKWFYENKNYASAYVLLAESMVTYTCECLGSDPTIRNNRNNAKGQVQNYFQNDGDISKIRNVISHASIENASIDYDDAINLLKNYLRDAARVILA